MEKVIKRESKFSIEEVFSSRELLGFLYGTALSNGRVYNNDSLVKNLETVCRIGGKGCVGSASNFPIKVADKIIKKYNRNGVMYDFSCGWGARMMMALKNSVEYLGTDPNYELVDKLQQMSRDYSKTIGKQVCVDIRKQGSENTVREWGGVLVSRSAVLRILTQKIT